MKTFAGRQRFYRSAGTWTHDEVLLNMNMNNPTHQKINLAIHSGITTL
jgi:hypothetical protein